MRAFDQFVEIIAKLRAPDGCPWDLEQTHKTLLPYCIEEAYEVADAIENNDLKELKEELGDLMLQIVLHSQIASEEKAFTIENVLTDISEKMIRRHPHVFGDKKISSSKEVIDQWSDLKKKEGKKVLDGIPKHAPQLFRSQKIGDKVASVGFDWKKIDDVWEKVREETKEVEDSKTVSEKEEELGDLLFSLVQWSRHLQIDAERCLLKSNQKFTKRFEWMERLVAHDQKQMKELSIEEWEAYWQKAKAL